MTPNPHPPYAGRPHSYDGMEPSSTFRALYHRQFYKTSICRWYRLGKCTLGANCRFAHGPEEQRGPPDLRGTALCPVLMTYGQCHKVRCGYAHSKEELRATPVFQKKVLCKAWLRGGCDNSRCRWAHGMEELEQNRPKSYLPQPQAFQIPKEDQLDRRMRVAPQAEHLVEEEKRLICLVCMEKERAILLRPCNHFVLCEDCYEKLCNDASSLEGVDGESERPQCPKCRYEVKDHLRVFT